MWENIIFLILNQQIRLWSFFVVSAAKTKKNKVLLSEIKLRENGNIITFVILQ